MQESIILSHSLTLILTAAALFMTVLQHFVKNKGVAAVLAVAGWLCALACIVYSLLLGAELTEILIFVLVLAVLCALGFLPDSGVKPEEEEKARKQVENDNTDEDCGREEK